MPSPTQRLKNSLKTRAYILYGIAVAVFIGSLFSYPYGLLVAFVGALLMLWGWKSSLRSDALPMDEPDEGPKRIVNISQYTLSERQKKD